MFQAKSALCTAIIIISRIVLDDFLEYFSSSYISSISNITSQNASNNLNDKANADTSDPETCFYLESEQNKGKLCRWSDQQVQVLKVQPWKLKKH